MRESNKRPEEGAYIRIKNNKLVISYDSSDENHVKEEEENQSEIGTE